MNRSITPTMLGIVLLSAALAGCGNRGGGSQVVAKVGESEITVSQLSQALHARGQDNAGGAATRQAVDSLINEQLLVDSAVSNKLDRDPAVVQALERARRQVLARAYVERMVFPTDAIGAAEQVEFYKKHPELFEQRKMFQVTTFSVKAGDVTDDLRSALATPRTPEEIGKVLTSRGISHDTQSLTRGTEQLPFEDLSRFTAAKVGDLIFMQPHESRMAIMLVQGVHDSPIGVDRAQPIIQQYLVNTRNAQALDEHLKQARAATKISYFDTVTAAAADTAASPLQGAVAVERSGARKSAVSLN
ncbi:MAG: EpsD family peptidyl-prolyl cis-trans isomerase [Gammaproteobacteria bacterium]